MATTRDPDPDRGVRVRLFLRIAVFESLLFAVLLGITQAFTTDAVDWPDRLRAIGFGAVGGLVVGIVVSLFLTQQQWSAAVVARDRRLAADPTASPTPDTSVVVRRTVRVPLPHAEVVRRIPDAAAALDRRRVRASDAGAGTVALSTPMSLRSWGERVVIAAGPEEGGSTPVTITSRPQLRVTLVDGGRNADNVERLETWLRGLTAVSENDLRPGPGLV
jgi:hypothetical protein